jgi:hypothetical protein
MPNKFMVVSICFTDLTIVIDYFLKIIEPTNL